MSPKASFDHEDVPLDASPFDLETLVSAFLNRRWIIASIFTFVLILTIFYTYTRTPIFEAKTLLLIEKESSNSGQNSLSSGFVVESSNDDYYQTQYELLRSYSLLSKVYAKLDLSKFEEFKNPDGVSKLRSAVSITPIRRSRLVHVSAESKSPTLAQEISVALSDLFVRENLSNLLFLSKEILDVLQASDKTSESSKLYDSLPAVVNNILIQDLKRELAKADSLVADLSGRYTPKHPVLRAAVSNQQALHQQIYAETQRIVNSLKTELSGKLKGNNVRIVDPARLPMSPIRPKKFRLLVFGTLLGIVFSILVALIVETLDQTLRRETDVQEHLGLPFLGIIPYVPEGVHEKAYHPILAKTSSVTGEAFRNLRTMVDFALAPTHSRHIMVTSSLQSEGKTYIATNVSAAISQLGKRTLLIDGDLRRPRLHNAIGVSNEKGLSDFLASEDDPEVLNTLVQDTEIPNLSVLVCGTRPPNPSELLNTPRLTSVVRWAEQNFDRIIVDCPPLNPIHDGLLWARHIPNMLFIALYGKTRTPLIRSSTERALQNGGNILGVVINAAKESSLAYAAYGYQTYNSYYAHTSEASH